MSTSTPATPYDVEIRVNIDDTYDSGHGEVSAGAAYEPADHFGDGVTMTHLVNAYRWVAGVLGRVGLTLASELVEVRREHGCRAEPKHFIHGCGVTGIDLDGTYENTDNYPLLSVIIPVGEVDTWTDKVRDTIERICAADRWQPSADDEARWVEPPKQATPVPRCHVCGAPLNPVLATAGETTHASCDPEGKR